MITYLEQFQVHSKTEEVQRFPIDSLLHRCKAFPISAFSTRIGYLLLMLPINTINDLTVKHCNCPRFIVYITVHSWCCILCVVLYMSLYKCIVTFSRYYTYIQNTFIGLKVLYAPHSLPSLHPQSWQPLIFLLSQQFSGMLHNWNHAVMQSFQIDFFHQ